MIPLQRYEPSSTPSDVATKLLCDGAMSNRQRKYLHACRQSFIVGTAPVVAEGDGTARKYVGHHDNQLVHTTALPRLTQELLQAKYRRMPHAKLLRLPRRLMTKRMQFQTLWQKAEKAGKTEHKAMIERTVAGIEAALEMVEAEIYFRDQRPVKIIDPARGRLSRSAMHAMVESAQQLLAQCDG